VFHAAVVRSYPPPPPDSEDARRWMEQGFQFPQPAALPQFEYALPMAETEASPSQASAAAASHRISSSDLDVDWDDPPVTTGAPAIDWTDPFESYFLCGDEVDLPEERVLLESLSVVSPETFRHEGALWNLALCLAYGSDQVAAAAARAFFDAVAEQDARDRVEWMNRTLLSRGFVPSGIPVEAGRRGVERLRSSCPPALTARLS
jgi:hypothetical protein